MLRSTGPALDTAVRAYADAGADRLIVALPPRHTPDRLQCYLERNAPAALAA